jgi:hypothetical protein
LSHEHSEEKLKRQTIGITENIIMNICEKNEVAASEVRGVRHFSKTLKGAGSIVPSLVAGLMYSTSRV